MQTDTQEHRGAHGVLCEARPVRHYRRPVQRRLTAGERERVTLLFGGLTVRHDRLIQAGEEALGYRVGRVPTPTKADFQTGKENCDYGMCNPVYFTAGALVNHLRRLRDEEGLSAEQIVNDYAFVTAGSCGPCRFGAYASQYRLALRNSGFEGFRVITFQQRESLNQSGEEPGLSFDAAFFIALLNGLLMGDVLNELANQIRPYEVHPGETDRVFGEVMARLERRMRDRGAEAPTDRWWTPLAAHLAKAKPADTARFLDQFLGSAYIDTLKECAELIEEGIEVDYTRAKPLCKVTGEFWAQTTEGDGNFKMFSFLESQGAEALVEPLTTWLSYLLNQTRTKVLDECGLGANGNGNGSGALKRFRARVACRKRWAWFGTVQWLLHREYNRIRQALGGTAHPLVDQHLLQRLGHRYYNRRCGGGEGHLEVAKTIYYANHQLAHMILSLKPFGCMPSTQSDGAQAAVLADHPDILFLPVETSGEGDIDAYSRVLMALTEAKERCRDEFTACVSESGYTVEQIRAYCRDHAELRRPLQEIPRHDGVVGRAANFVMHVAERMRRDAEGGAR